MLYQEWNPGGDGKCGERMGKTDEWGEQVHEGTPVPTLNRQHRDQLGPERGPRGLAGEQPDFQGLKMKEEKYLQ